MATLEAREMVNVFPPLSIPERCLMRGAEQAADAAEKPVRDLLSGDGSVIGPALINSIVALHRRRAITAHREARKRGEVLDFEGGPGVTVYVGEQELAKMSKIKEIIDGSEHDKKNDGTEAITQVGSEIWSVYLAEGSFSRCVNIGFFKPPLIMGSTIYGLETYNDNIIRIEGDKGELWQNDKYTTQGKLKTPTGKNFEQRVV